LDALRHRQWTVQLDLARALAIVDAIELFAAWVTSARETRSSSTRLLDHAASAH
jgi:hypothetical protein